MNNEKSNNCQNYQIMNADDYKKYAFEYYLISQVSSDRIDYAQLLSKQDDNIQNLETIIVYQNKHNQCKKELPQVLKNFEKWSFPQGVKLIQQSDPKFKMLDDFYHDPQAKLGSNIHEINYFVVTDLGTLQKYYCTSAYFYEKIIFVDKNEQPHQFYIPKSHVIMSCAPFFCAQKSLIGYLLHVHRMKQSTEQDKIIQVTQDEKVYGIEQSKLFEYYIQYTYDNCMIQEANEKVQLKFHTNDKFLLYYTKNNINNMFYSIVNPSNNFFESLMFSQSPYNLLNLVTYILLEYQIILVSKRTNSLTLFAENLLELIKPLFWRGVYIPNLVVPSIFDYENTKLPYIIGFHRKDFKSVETDKSQESNQLKQNRVVYDIDENSFLYINETQANPSPRIPLVYRNYFIRKINLIIGDIKFYEEEYFSQAILRYKQFFYDFILLIFHDLFMYFSNEEHEKGKHTKCKSNGEIQNQSTKADPQVQTTASTNYFQKSLNCLDQQQSIGGTKQIGNSEKNSKSSKKIVYFNYKKYIASYEERDQPFFSLLSKTLIFNGLIKDCFRAMEFREEFFSKERKQQYDYNFGSVICFIEDVKFLSNRATDEVTLNDKIKELEDTQHKIIAEQLSGSPMVDIQLNADNGLVDYLESLFRVSSRPDSYERLHSTNQYSSYLSSFLNNPFDIQKEIVNNQGSKQKIVVCSNLNAIENLKEGADQNFQTKEQFLKQYSIERHNKKPQNSQKENKNLGKIQSDFNEENWQINTQSSEDITVDTNRNNIKSFMSQNIRELSLYHKTNRLINYQKIDEDELYQKKYQNKFDGCSTAFEVHSTNSAYINNKLSRKNSFKEFAKISNELNLLPTMGKSQSNQKSMTSILPLPEDLMSANVEK
ncbi:DENN (AEX-3) domain protein (macronuclear) [Tetrahymena thermophila SB210]|uniref:DENN (AEX-3) domain protein n=1 Tax=Tetrahymena thermophila (strain SB210) TaxID=312017 RepID=Q23MG4_TETTS|nr:DENN (AEX-3) domain protein [Tetrahymena thermophila SB210]EAR97675.2 DENN (AEX-3) domain protein [Tetrahymena thermophila SB210]|eukprot:XP_001017920.2 DENN (AEX-3) domain protein [Tetrahymena thermophila SB210]